MPDCVSRGVVVTVPAQGEGRETVYIASCPKHGLTYGDRSTCFICGGPVEVVELVQSVKYEAAANGMRALAADVKAWSDEADRLRAENERLREALAWVAEYGSRDGDLKEGWEEAMRNVARNTLDPLAASREGER